MPENILNKTVGEMFQDSRSYYEVYWKSIDDGNNPVGIVFAKGIDEVAILKEVMNMVRKTDDFEKKSFIVSDKLISEMNHSSKQGSSIHDLSHQRDESVDILISCLSDMVRTYKNSEEEQRAIGVFKATCPNPEEVVSKAMVSLLSLISHNEDISLENVASYITKHRSLIYSFIDISSNIERMK
jgi:hypothetical protein